MRLVKIKQTEQWIMDVDSEVTEMEVVDRLREERIARARRKQDLLLAMEIEEGKYTTPEEMDLLEPLEAVNDPRGWDFWPTNHKLVKKRWRSGNSKYRIQIELQKEEEIPRQRLKRKKPLVAGRSLNKDQSKLQAAINIYLAL